MEYHKNQSNQFLFQKCHKSETKNYVCTDNESLEECHEKRRKVKETSARKSIVINPKVTHCL